METSLFLQSKSGIRNICTLYVLSSKGTKGLYTWSDLHTCATFAYMQNLNTYANRSMCTHLLTYAKFARMQKLENLHLLQTKCKSHFAYMQILHICKSCHVNGKQICTREYLFNSAK